MMHTTLRRRLTGTIGIVVGLLSIASGSAVLLGIKQPDYIVLLWLVIYNVLMGFVSVAAGAGIWLSRILGKRLSMIIASAHTAILFILILFYVFNISVATESMAAMTFRAFVWIGITLSIVKDKGFKPSYI